jgi:protein TonB
VLGGALCGTLLFAVVGRSHGPSVSAQPESHLVPQLPQATADEPPLEATSLVGPGDRPPLLSDYAQPASPHPEVPLRPTIPCRVLVDGTGAVVKAYVYQHRPGFEEYDAAALSAARTYRFEPAMRAGAPVAAWTTLPVLFQELPRPSYPSLFQ